MIGVAIAAGTTATVLVATRETGSPAERLARDACRHVARFTRIVEHNGPAPDATRELEAAERSAHRASSFDVRWIQLDSGVQTLQLAFSKDDAGAADEGLRVVRTQCREAG